MLIKIDDADCFTRCVHALQAGKVLILPTDTIYGFSGIVPDTESKILKIKKRPAEKKMIQLIAKPEDVYKYTAQVIPPTFFKLWPAPLSLIVKAKNSDETIAFRCPDKKWLRDLIEAVGTPLYSSSVNISGKKSLTSIAEIYKTFKHTVPIIVNAGDEPAIASTVVDLTLDEPMILRRGSLSL